MKFVSKTLTGLAAVSLIVAQPAMAQVRSADSLPEAQPIQSVERVGAPVGRNEQFAGNPAIAIGLVIAILIGLGFIIAGDSNEDSPG